MTALDMSQHLLGFRMGNHGFATYGFEVIYLFDIPAFGLCVIASSFFVMFRAFPSCLVFR